VVAVVAAAELAGRATELEARAAVEVTVPATLEVGAATTLEVGAPTTIEALPAKLKIQWTARHRKSGAAAADANSVVAELEARTSELETRGMAAEVPTE
jgi:hypothetical protein